MFGVGQVVRAIGAVCGGSRRGVSWGDAMPSSGGVGTGATGPIERALKEQALEGAVEERALGLVSNSYPYMPPVIPGAHVRLSLPRMAVQNKDSRTLTHCGLFVLN